ncbi:MAG: hypothetical protein ABI203_04795 [Mucilaginibacter sp.]
MNLTDSLAKIAHHTKLDTLQAEVHQLRLTIDSLHQEMHDISAATSTQLWTLLIPVFSVIVAGLITYRFGIKSKMFDLLYASKIPAFKEITTKLTEYKAFCRGRVAYYQANEFSPYYTDAMGALHHRTEIAKVVDINSIFLSKANRDSISSLIGDMGSLCNIELYISSGDTKDYSEVYIQAAKRAEDLIEIMYYDLNLR